ncbi:MAG: 50S ribosomal protein L30 [Actinomycetota bacterium]
MSGEAGRIRITLVRSSLGRHPKQRRTVRALGLKKLHQSVVHDETPEIMGMVNRVKHLVETEPLEEV